MINPYMILGALLALAVAGVGGFAAGDRYEGLVKDKAFQVERNTWAAQQDALVAAHQKALADATSERDTLQRYVSNTLAPKYAALAVANATFQRELNDRSEQHAKELPADDRACDLPASMFDDWKQSNAGPRRGDSAGGAAGSRLDVALPRPPNPGGSVAGATQSQPPSGH